MNIDLSFHYPAELMNLLVDTIPLLNRGKKDVFLFFRGAGVADSLMQAPHTQWKSNKDSIGKHEIVRQVLTKLNERGEASLRERREVVKRVVEFESYSACWPADELKARGLVAEIQKVVNVKDSFTRMNKEREAERKVRMDKVDDERNRIQKKHQAIAALRGELFSLFAEIDRWRRGKALEGILNRLFETYGILVREAFTLTGSEGEGIVEQIDGVVEMDGHLYFVEMKWWDSPLGVPEVSQHMMRVMFRAESRAIIISASQFTGPAIATCKEALQQKVVVLCTLQELVALLEREGDLKTFLTKKAHSAQIDKNPFCEARA